MPDLVGPGLELQVVGHAAFQGDGLVLGASGGFARGGRIAALAVLDHFGGALEGADLAHAGDVAAIPLDAEFEVLVGIEAMGVDGELGHDPTPFIADRRRSAGW
ncbi:hypothetical protein D3C77_615620 [compost metagenome]